MFIIGNKRKNMDYEPEEEVKTSSGIFYQNEIIEFDNIESFVAKLYQENTLVVPLSSNIQVILGGKDDYEDSDIIPHDLEVDYELAEGMINENALSEKIIIEEIIVMILNLKAGIIECVSHIIEIKPSGTVTLKKLKIYLLKKFVIVESKE